MRSTAHYMQTTQHNARLWSTMGVLQHCTPMPGRVHSTPLLTRMLWHKSKDTQPACERQQLCASTALLPTTVPVRAHTPPPGHSYSRHWQPVIVVETVTQQHANIYTLTHPSLLPRGIKPPSRFLRHMLQKPGCVPSTINPLGVRETLASHQG